MSQNQNSAQEQANLDALLDATLDDLADLPEFVTPADGHYLASIKWETKTVNGHPAVSCKVTFREAVELANPEDVAPKAGSTCDVMYMLDNEFGQGALKKVLAPLREHFGVVSMREIFEASTDAEVNLVLKSKAGKQKAGSSEPAKLYTSIVSLSVA